MLLFPFLLAALSLLLSVVHKPFESNAEAFLQRTVSPTRVLLLTAHPDDECFFFAPTIFALQRSSSRPEIFSLCLSTGNADGMGERRKGELERSLDVLGVDEDKRWIIEHPQLQDNFTQEWDAEVIAQVLWPFVIEHHITSVLTFDLSGISLHPNHYSLPLGASHLINFLSSSSDISAPSLFSLVTVPVIPKYTGLFSAVFARLRIVSQAFWPVEPTVDPDPVTVFISGIPDYVKTVRAILAHDSQLVWFRYLYMTFSRYMWVNELAEFKTQTSLFCSS